jgi:protein-tyrosine phosphatase
VIDTHCHLLPGLDDGPATLDGALELARVLEGQGVTAVLCTPHYSRAYGATRAEAEEAGRALAALLREHGVALELHVAAEVSDAMAVSAPLAELQARSAGRYLIVEVLSDTPAVLLETVSSRLGEIGLIPVFAHPERSRAVQHAPGILDAARSAGALVQVVAPSLVGRWGAAVETAVWNLLDRGRVDLLASDAHGVERRRSHLAPAAELVTRRFGTAARAELTVRRPAEVIAATRVEAT